MTSLRDPATSLDNDYIPESFVNRDEELQTLTTTISSAIEGPPTHLFLTGPPGTGKTQTSQKALSTVSDAVPTCYISCILANTQYQVLQQLYTKLTGDSVNSGYHISDLQRKLEEQFANRSAVIVLDDVEFLLFNDGGNLLYYLSRCSSNLCLVLISGTRDELSDQVDGRVFSSLTPQTVQFERYTQEQLYQILHERAEKALQSRSVQEDALTYISTQTQNATVGRIWLKTAVETVADTITEETVTRVQEKAVRRYVDHQLREFSAHHHLLWQALRELEHEQTPPFQTGTIYNRYTDLCDSYAEKVLSERRVSDFLKHFELLHLAEVDYHYGGRKGKTREVRPQWVSEGDF